MPKRPIVVLVVVLACLSRSSSARAGCNLIPVAEKFYPSSLSGTPSGSVSAPIAAPGRIVRVSVNPACDALPSGFTAFQTSDTVDLTFEPPNGGPAHAVQVAPGNVLVLNETTLQFIVPDTTGAYPPFGLAGPATITVRDASSQTIASIGPLSQPTHTCDREAETVFQHFTVLPVPNDVATQSSGSPTQMRMTVDGGGDLLIPLDHTGAGVLPLGPGAPIARLLRADTSYPAFPSGPTPTLSQAFASALTIPNTTSDSLLRSFTIDGRPLPPLLRFDDSGKIFGTTDADFSVLRVNHLDGNGQPIYDVASRFSGNPADVAAGHGGGPVVIGPAFTLTRCDPVPIRGLRSAPGVAVFARDESVEGVNLNAASGDTDTTDKVVQVVNVSTGGQSCGFDTAMAVIDNAVQGFSGPPGPMITASGSLVAFLESEAGQNDTDLNGDGDTFDGILRVFTSGGVERTPTLPVVTVDRGPHVNGRSLAISGSLVYARTPDGDPGFVEKFATPFSPSATAVSPDGLHVYAVDNNSHFTQCTRNPGNGQLTTIPGGPIDPATASPSIVVAPNGLHVYVGHAANAARAIEILDRNPGTGNLSANSLAPIAGAVQEQSLAVSPDGRFIYAANFQTSSIDIFTTNPVTGATAFSSSVVDNTGGVDGLQGVFSVALSPDGSNLYAAGSGEDAVAVFKRDVATGALTFVSAMFEGFAGVTGLNAPETIAVSPDGNHVYASGSALDTTVVFSRDVSNPATLGALTFAQHVAAGGSSIAISPTGGEVYIASLVDDSLKVFSRNAATGVLSQVTTRTDGVGGFDGLGGASGVAIAPDGQNVYVAGTTDTGIGVVRSDTGQLRVLDANTGSYRVTPQTQAVDVAVSGDHAVLLTPEPFGVTNGDADSSDLIPQVYDATADTMTSLGVAANRIAIGNDLVAMTVSEQGQGANLNGDGDMTDDVVVWWRVGDPAPVPLTQTLGDSATGASIAVVNAPTADYIAFLAPEFGTGPVDLNGDGDTLDRVLRVITPGPPAARLPNFNLAVDDFVVGGSVIAFRVNERAQGNTDLDGNGTTSESVMYVADLADGLAAEPISTGQSAIPCTLAGCEDKAPYKVSGDTVTFLTSECLQGGPLRSVGCPTGGTDINHDGDPDDLVLQAFNLKSRTLQFIATVVDGPEAPSPFPDTSFDGPIIYVQAPDVNDINHNNDTTDPVILIVGDQDNDGTFDNNDTCVEQSNPTQTDDDLDGLGDSCDPTAFCDTYVPPAPLAAPSMSAACQKIVGTAASGYLKQRATAIEKCLDGIAKGSISGDPTNHCRGSVQGAAIVPPTNAKTAAKLDKAASKFLAKVAQCTDPQVAPLGACGDTADALAQCVAAAYESGAVASTMAAYGDVTATPLPAQQKCVSAIGKASVKYVSKVAQAMQKCLDRVSAGALVGNAQALCLGALSASGVVAPTDSKTSGPIAKAEADMRAQIAAKCPDPMLLGLHACGSTVTDAGNCLACSNWRRAAEAVRSVYGPQ